MIEGDRSTMISIQRRPKLEKSGMPDLPETSHTLCSSTPRTHPKDGDQRWMPRIDAKKGDEDNGESWEVKRCEASVNVQNWHCRIRFSFYQHFSDQMARHNVGELAYRYSTLR